MASYTHTQLYGSGSIGETINSGVDTTFTFTNPSGSSYFTMETIPSSSGFYEATSPKNFSGSFVVSESMGLVTSSYIASIVVQPGTQSFKFTPAITVTDTTYYLRGTGGYSLNIASTAAPVAPVNTSPPELIYTFRYEGEPVDTSDGTWDNSPTSFTYQWYRDATPISGETLSQYILTSSDVDTEITCQVTAINAGGSSTPAPSDAIYVFDYDYGQVYYYYEDTAEAKSILQNQFMLAIKAAGVWAKLDVLCVFRGSGSGAALVDWKRLIQIVNNECTFNTTQGFTGNSSIFSITSIDTNFTTNSGTNYTQDNASRYFFPYAFSGTGPMDGNEYNVMNLGATTINKINSETDLDSAFQYTTTVEPKSIHRTSDTDVTLFNGTTSASRTNTSEPNGNPLSILYQNGDRAAHTVAAYAAGASMVAENTAFVAAWNTYITAL
jgi:hypothetical protein